MSLRPRNWLGAATAALACTLVVGRAAAEPSDSATRPGATTQRSEARTVRPPTRASAGADQSDAPLIVRLFSNWVLYESLAEWQLRSELDYSSYSVARRTLRAAVALATARPGAAIASVLTAEPPLLEQRPVAGGVRSGYGVRRDPFKRKRWTKHNGVDLMARRGVPVLAAGPGMVTKATRLPAYGRVVYLDHGGGVQTRYAHLQKILVREGQFVPLGGLLGKVGSSGRATGPHLHFEVRANGKAVAPIEILGRLTAHTPLSGWLERLADGELPPPPAPGPEGQVIDGQVTQEPQERPHKRGGKVRNPARDMRSGRPTS